MLPADKDNEIYFHRGAWWNNEPLVQETFGGGLTDLEQIRRASQFMQYEGLKYSVECNLRRAMRNSASLPWQFNEPYPNLFCTCVVDYYGMPKPAYYGIKKIYGAYAVTAAFESPSLADKAEFSAEIYGGGRVRCVKKFGITEKTGSRTENMAEQGAGEWISQEIRICAGLYDMNGGRIHTQEWTVPENECDRQEKAGTFICSLPEISTTLFVLRVRAFFGDLQIAENEYLFTKEVDFGAVYRQEAQVSVQIRDEEAELSNTGEVAALFVHLTQEDGAEDGYVYFENNYVCLMPGESKIIRMEGACSRLAVQALNMAHQIIETQRR